MAISKRLSKWEKPLKKQKITNSNIEDKPRAKVVAFYRDIFTFRQMPATNTFIEKLATEFVAYARENPTFIRLMQFLAIKGIPRKTFQRWVVEFPLLAEAHDIAWDFIAMNRETGVCVKDDKGNTKLTPHALVNLHQYDEEWKSGEEWRAQITTKDDKNTSNIRVVMEAYPSSPLVPDKKKDSDE